MRTSAIPMALLALSLLFAAAWTGRRIPGDTGFLFRSIKVGAEEFKYAVYIPRGYDAATAWPAIVFLHGSCECGTDGQKQLAVGLPLAVMLQPERWPCIIICPQKPEQAKEWEDYDSAVMAMLAAAREEWKIDGDRIYLTGLSQGGQGTWTLGAAHADTFAAVAPVCGYVRRMDPAELARNLRRMPSWSFHGEDDPIVPVQETRKMHAALREARGDQSGSDDPDARLTTYPGVGHESWERAYMDPELPRWLLSRRRQIADK